MSVFHFYAFLPNTSLVNKFILINRRLYNGKYIDNISVLKKQLLVRRVFSEQYRQHTLKLGTIYKSTIFLADVEV